MYRRTVVMLALVAAVLAAGVVVGFTTGFIPQLFSSVNDLTNYHAGRNLPQELRNRGLDVGEKLLENGSVVQYEVTVGKCPVGTAEWNRNDGWILHPLEGKVLLIEEMDPTPAEMRSDPFYDGCIAYGHSLATPPLPR